MSWGGSYIEDIIEDFLSVFGKEGGCAILETTASSQVDVDNNILYYLSYWFTNMTTSLSKSLQTFTFYTQNKRLVKKRMALFPSDIKRSKKSLIKKYKNKI